MSGLSTDSAGYTKLRSTNNSNPNGNGDSDSEVDERESRSLRVHNSSHARYGSISPSPLHTPEEPSDRERRESYIQQDEDPLQVDIPPAKVEEKPITWSSLPHKRQLAILTVARLSEPLVQTSLRVSLIFGSSW